MLTRRNVVIAGLALPFVQGRALAQTPACGQADRPPDRGPVLQARFTKTRFVF